MIKNDGAIEKQKNFHIISKAAAGYWGGEDRELKQELNRHFQHRRYHRRGSRLQDSRRGCHSGEPGVAIDFCETAWKLLQGTFS